MSLSWVLDSGKIYSGYLNFFFFDDKKFSIRVEFCLIFLQFLSLNFGHSLLH